MLPKALLSPKLVGAKYNGLLLNYYCHLVSNEVLQPNAKMPIGLGFLLNSYIVIWVQISYEPTCLLALGSRFTSSAICACVVC